MIGSIIAWVVIGLIAGTIAAAVTKSNTDVTGLPSWVENAVLGILGAVLGGLILGLFDVGRDDDGIGFWLGSIVTAFIGAVVLLLVVKAVRNRANKRV